MKHKISGMKEKRILLLFLLLCTVILTQANIFVKIDPKYAMVSVDWFRFYSLFYHSYTNYTFVPTPPKEGMCTPCDFAVRNTEPNSTPRDLILTVALGGVQNLIVFMRTLRTTGSKCSVVILTDHKAYLAIGDETREYAQNCGCQIIDCGDDPVQEYKFGPHNYCYYLMYLFLYNNQGKFDRVVNIDLYDAAFQGDPFNFQVNTTHLNMIDEGSDYTTDNGEWMYNWYKDGFGLLTDEERKDLYLCSGYLGGPPSLFMLFIEEFLKITIWEKGIADQATYNYLVTKGALANVSRNKVRKNELVYNIAFKRLKDEPNQMGDIRTIRNVNFHSVIIHQYYFSPPFAVSLLRACPRESPTMDRYIAHCDFSCFNQVESCAKNSFCDGSQISIQWS